MKTFRAFRAKSLQQAVLALTLAASTTMAEAQLGLPSLNLPVQTRGLPLGGDLLHDADSRLGRIRDLPDVRALRLMQVKSLLR